ncbi:MAG: NAD-dependent epimerase/dehydratase family protein [Alcaligenaceae bacterium]|nr:NAD-dependent epimerase/dehydratase family protein [Alcaligenaceae bacterium]
MTHPKKTILIAGCGDLGLRVAQNLLQQGHTVYGLRKEIPQNRPPLQLNGNALHWLPFDLCQTEASTPLLANINDIVYCPAPGDRSEAAYQHIYINGLRNLLTLLDTLFLRRVVFISSSAVYGEHRGEWVNENTPLAPLGTGGRVLQEAEQHVWQLPFETCVLRLAGLYGPEKQLLNERIRQGQATVPRHEKHYANRIHLEDAAAAVVHCLTLDKPAPCYIASDDTPMGIDELYDWIATLLNAPAAQTGTAPAGIGNKRLDNSLLKQSGFRLRWPDTKQGYASFLNK